MDKWPDADKQKVTRNTWIPENLEDHESHFTRILKLLLQLYSWMQLAALAWACWPALEGWSGLSLGIPSSSELIKREFPTCPCQG